VRLLRTTLVVVVGVGTVGSQIARELANTGVGRLRLIDHDLLESHNLPRHALAADYLGKNKAKGMALYLRKNITTLQVESIPRKIDEAFSDNELDEMLSDADLIVVATDDRKAQRRIARRALSLDIPAVLPALYRDGGGEVFVQFSPLDPCFFCWDGFRPNNQQLREVRAVNADALPVISLAVQLSLEILDSSAGTYLDVPPNDPRPRQLFVHEPFAALAIGTVQRRENCPSCAVGPPGANRTSQQPTAASSARPSSTSQQTLFESATDVLAALLATGALVWPFLWMSFATFAAFIVICTRGIRLRGIKHGPADLIVIPLRIARTGAIWLVSRIVTIVPVVIAGVVMGVCAVIALAIPFAIGAAIWFVMHGVDGWLTAARLAAADYGLRVFALLTCYLCFHWMLSRGSIAHLVQARARTLSESSLAAAAGIAIVSFVLCGFVLPQHIWAPVSGLNELVSHAPPGIRGPISDGRVALAEYEAQAVVRCMADHNRYGWNTPRATAHPDGSITMTVEASSSHPPRAGSRAVLMLSLENQLAHHVDNIAIGDTIKYALRPASSPVRNVADLARSSTNRASAKRISKLSTTESDIKVVLRCSAAAV